MQAAATGTYNGLAPACNLWTTGQFRENIEHDSLTGKGTCEIENVDKMVMVGNNKRNNCNSCVLVTNGPQSVVLKMYSHIDESLNDNQYEISKAAMDKLLNKTEPSSSFVSMNFTDVICPSTTTDGEAKMSIKFVDPERSAFMIENVPTHIEKIAYKTAAMKDSKFLDRRLEFSNYFNLPADARDVETTLALEFQNSAIGLLQIEPAVEGDGLNIPVTLKNISDAPYVMVNLCDQNNNTNISDVLDGRDGNHATSLLYASFAGFVAMGFAAFM